jgi:hypothetical protein
MRFMLLCGLVAIVYTGLAYARSAGAGCCGASMPAGIEFAFVVSVQVLVAVLIVFVGALLWSLAPRRHSEPARSSRT